MLVVWFCCAGLVYFAIACSVVFVLFDCGGLVWLLVAVGYACFGWFDVVWLFGYF